MARAQRSPSQATGLTSTISAGEGVLSRCTSCWSTATTPIMSTVVPASLPPPASTQPTAASVPAITPNMIRSLRKPRGSHALALRAKPASRAYCSTRFAPPGIFDTSMTYQVWRETMKRAIAPIAAIADPRSPRLFTAASYVVARTGPDAAGGGAGGGPARKGGTFPSRLLTGT